MAGSLSGCGGPSAPLLPDIVLISLDTTRADHIGAYGSEVRTPFIDRFASGGVIFENVSAACTTTLPSHVSMLTGLWPTRHGVARNGFTVSDANRMLPEILRERGYVTIGVSAAVALSELLNFPQGFDRWDQDPETFSGPAAANRDARRAGEISDAAIRELETVSRRPLFLFVHYVDPHAPNDPPEPYRSAYGPVEPGMDGSPAAVRRARELADRRPGVATEVDLQLARLYAGEVSYLDQEVGRLLEALATAGRFEDALIVITADHGETFWEHGDRWSHGHATYETTVRVPLMLRLPRGAHAGVRVTTPVSGVDLMPTLLELAGLATPPGLDGESLVPTLSGRELSRTGSFSQGPLPAGRLERETRRWTNERKAQSVRSGSWKLVRLPAGRGEELYDLARDPGEQHDLAASDDPDTRRRKAELAGALSAWNEAADPFPSEFFPRRRATDGPDAEARRAMWERLRALGYVTDDDEPGSDP